MRYEVFKAKSTLVSEVFRAECKASHKWKGKWRNYYNEAHDDAEKHRDNNPGHRVVIKSKITTEMDFK